MLSMRGIKYKLVDDLWRKPAKTRLRVYDTRETHRYIEKVPCIIKRIYDMMSSYEPR